MPWDSLTLKLCYLSFLLEIFQWKTLVEVKTVIAELGESQPWQEKIVLMQIKRPLQMTVFGAWVLWVPFYDCSHDTNTVGIQLPLTTGIQIMNIYPIAEWSINWMVTWKADKKSGNWVIIRYLWTNNRHLWNIRPLSYQTFCLLLRPTFGYQTKSLVTEWSIIQLTD